MDLSSLLKYEGMTLEIVIWSLFIGIVIGIIGMAMAIVNYPIHKGILNARKKKYFNKADYRFYDCH